MLSHQSINLEAFTGTNKLPASLYYASICLEARTEVVEIVNSCCHYFSDLVIIVVPTVIVSLLTIGVLVVVIIILKRR